MGLAAIVLNKYELMKLLSLIVALTLTSIISNAQNAKEILQKSYHTCQAIQNGYFETTFLDKRMHKKDTAKTDYNCYFKKIKNDSLLPMSFHATQIFSNGSKSELIYTGEEYVMLTPKDSIAETMSTTIWAKEIKSRKHRSEFFAPVTSKKSSPIQHDSMLNDSEYVYKLIGEEKINTHPCYHLQVNKLHENDTKETLMVMKEELNLWITKADYLPIQYSLQFDNVMNNDTMIQYEKYILNKYEFNTLKDTTVLTMNSIPSFYKLKDYSPDKRSKPLPNDTIAPNWDLVSLSHEKISLQQLKGQLVLIDFFYKNCFNCLQAMPVLQSLNDKYKNKGLRIIGIDPFDKNENELNTFLKKRGINYSIVLSGKETAKAYRVSGYPTLYLVDKSGKIVFLQVGYGKDTEATLEEIIKVNLAK